MFALVLALGHSNNRCAEIQWNVSQEQQPTLCYRASSKYKSLLSKIQQNSCAGHDSNRAGFYNIFQRTVKKLTTNRREVVKTKYKKLSVMFEIINIRIHSLNSCVL